MIIICIIILLRKRFCATICSSKSPICTRTTNSDKRVRINYFTLSCCRCCCISNINSKTSCLTIKITVTFCCFSGKSSRTFMYFKKCQSSAPPIFTKKIKGGICHPINLSRPNIDIYYVQFEQLNLQIDLAQFYHYLGHPNQLHPCRIKQPQQQVKFLSYIQIFSLEY